RDAGARPGARPTDAASAEPGRGSLHQGPGADTWRRPAKPDAGEPGADPLQDQRPERGGSQDANGAGPGDVSPGGDQHSRAGTAGLASQRSPDLLDRRPLAPGVRGRGDEDVQGRVNRKSTRLNSSHVSTSYAVFCLKKK